MAINHADGTTLGTLVVCPIAAGFASASAHAGWLTVMFVISGFVAGFAVAAAVRTVAYWALDAAIAAEKQSWRNWVFGIAYTFLPPAVSAAGIAGIWIGTIRLAMAIV